MKCFVLTIIAALFVDSCIGRDPNFRGRPPVNGSEEHDPNAPTIIGIRVESYDSIQGFDKGTVWIYADLDAPIRFFGSNLNNHSSIKFTTSEYDRGSVCDEIDQSVEFIFQEVGALDENNKSDTGVAIIKLREADNQKVHHICIRNGLLTETSYIHQGPARHLLIHAVHRLPLWFLITSVFVLQAFSGLFSGLNLGLLSLDPRELQILASVGSAKEREYALNIIPLRNRGNFLMCALVICNSGVNAGLTKVLDDLTNSEGYGVAISTLGVTLFGEIIPQTICARHGLAIGSGTRYITYLVMALTAVISYPLSRMLDRFLGGRDAKTLYDRERLMELIKVTKEENLLDNNELNIITGTLALKRKKVFDIMTRLEEVFMLPYDSVLDFETLAQISRQGFTRIPIYDRAKANIVGLLNIKDLALLDPDDCTSVKTLCMYYNYELCFVKDSASLDLMLEEFKKGRSHMAFVRHFIGEAEAGRDPAFEVIGVVTLEDIIEEMIQAEISDESDITELDRHKPWTKSLSIFTSRPLYATLITPQLQHAAFQFMSTSLDPFRDDLMSQSILKRLIHHHDVAKMIKRRSSDHEAVYLYKAGQPADYFTLILEGRVHVTLGSEGLVFDSGPFTHFGTSALTLSPEERITYTTLPVPSPPSDRRTSSATSKTGTSWWGTVPTGYFVPDFTVIVNADVLIIQIRRAHYLAALRATALERSKAASAIHTAVSRPTLTTTDDIFQKEMEQAAKHNASKRSQAVERTSGMIFQHHSHHGVHKKEGPTSSHQDIPTSHPDITYRRMHPVTVEAKLAARKMELINNEAVKLPTITEKLTIPPNKDSTKSSGQDKKK